MTAGNARVTLNNVALKQASGARAARRQRRWAGANGADLHQIYHTVLREAPMGEFSTGDIFALLGILTNTEAPMAALTSGGLVMTYPSANDAGPGFASTSTHVRATIASGQAYLESLRITPQAPVEATVMVLGTSADGTTDPLAIANNVAAPTPITDGIAWALSAATLGGSPLTGIASITLTVEHQATTEADPCYNAHLPYPLRVLSAGAAGQIAIGFQIETYDFRTVFANGTLVLSLKSRNANTPTLASATGTITIAGALLDQDDRSGATPGTRTLTGLARFDGTTKPWTTVAPA